MNASNEHCPQHRCFWENKKCNRFAIVCHFQVLPHGLFPTPNQQGCNAEVDLAMCVPGSASACKQKKHALTMMHMHIWTIISVVVTLSEFVFFVLSLFGWIHSCTEIMVLPLWIIAQLPQ